MWRSWRAGGIGWSPSRPTCAASRCSRPAPWSASTAARSTGGPSSRSCAPESSRSRRSSTPRSRCWGSSTDTGGSSSWVSASCSAGPSIRRTRTRRRIVCFAPSSCPAATATPRAISWTSTRRRTTLPPAQRTSRPPVSSSSATSCSTAATARPAPVCSRRQPTAEGSDGPCPGTARNASTRIRAGPSPSTFRRAGRRAADV
jgi:hypothetical protein